MSFAFYATYLGLWALAIFQSLVLLALVREVTEMKRRLSERGTETGDKRHLPLGTKAPDFSTVEIWSGRRMRRRDLLGKKSVLLFLSTNCKVCENLASEVHGIYHKADGNLFAVCEGEPAECARFFESRGIQMPVLLDAGGEISSKFQVIATPIAVMLDDQARIRSYGYPRRGEDVEKIFETPFDPLPQAEPVAELPQAS